VYMCLSLPNYQPKDIYTKGRLFVRESCLGSVRFSDIKKEAPLYCAKWVRL